jgi:hypothetical protein
MPVHTQIDLAVNLLEQPLHKLRKDGGLECALKYHEGERTLVRDGRDPVPPDALAVSREGSPRRIACPRHVGTVRRSPAWPAGQSSGISVSATARWPHRSSRRHVAPASAGSSSKPEIAPHGDERDLDPVFPRNPARHAARVQRESGSFS